MGQVLDFIKGFFFRKEKESKANAEELRVDFRARYHQFKLLLNANNKSLEIMADIERALRLGQPFGMSFVKATCTAISVNVFQMIKNLAELGPGKYNDLSNRFNGIQHNIDQLLTERKEVEDERLIIPLSSIDKEMADLVGSKMANLGEIKNKIKIQVPEGFSITSAAYQKFMEHHDLQSEIERRFQSADLENMERLYTLSAEIQQLIIRSRPPEDLHEAIMNACRELEGVGGGEMRLAVRSSALGEDTAGTSFAGQYRTELNVSSEEIIEAYKEVIASKYSLPAITYRLNRGFRDEDISMGVGCLVMIDAEAGGVIYSRNPVDLNDSSIFINSVWGLPESVVDGSVACDLFVVTREKPIRVIRKEIKVKEKKSIRRSQDGVSRIDLPRDMGELPSIDEAQACILAELAIKMEEYYTLPQDIEWAIDPDGAIYILQCRPLQQMETAKIALPEDMIRPHKEDVVVRGGITASQGSACGPVYLADTGVDILRFPEGAVLVVQQALPKWASLLSRAAAVVTEQGSFAGHLANVAREFGVPALFGVKGVRDQLNSGETITVDAGGLIIYKGKVDSLLVESDTEKNLMQGSPVYDTLKQVSRHIIPLNLLDPDSPDFNPTNCKTFHDITRFVHEKSVHEMFSFGKDHDFSER
ncbi:MAG: PEP-utilizing enzyme, partial [Desulfobacteraceae bacterium]|nr:PEP-utilizing enzyme [Desulfobacteraceae bacterium]